MNTPPPDLHTSEFPSEGQVQKARIKLEDWLNQHAEAIGVEELGTFSLFTVEHDGPKTVLSILKPDRQEPARTLTKEEDGTITDTAAHPLRQPPLYSGYSRDLDEMQRRAASAVNRTITGHCGLPALARLSHFNSIAQTDTKLRLATAAVNQAVTEARVHGKTVAVRPEKRRATINRAVRENIAHPEALKLAIAIIGNRNQVSAQHHNAALKALKPLSELQRQSPNMATLYLAHCATGGDRLKTAKQIVRLTARRHTTRPRFVHKH